jgi:hypothetical protein
MSLHFSSIHAFFDAFPLEKIKWFWTRRTGKPDNWIPTANLYVQKMAVQLIMHSALKVERDATVLKPHALINIMQYILQ